VVVTVVVSIVVSGSSMVVVVLAIVVVCEVVTVVVVVLVIVVVIVVAVVVWVVVLVVIVVVVGPVVVVVGKVVEAPLLQFRRRWYAGSGTPGQVLLSEGQDLGPAAMGQAEVAESTIFWRSMVKSWMAFSPTRRSNDTNAVGAAVGGI